MLLEKNIFNKKFHNVLTATQKALQFQIKVRLAMFYYIHIVNNNNIDNNDNDTTIYKAP